MSGEETIAGQPSEQDPEVKRVVAMATTTSAPEVMLADRIKYFSSWFRSQKAVAFCIRYVRILKLRVEEGYSHCVAKDQAAAEETPMRLASL